MKLFKIFTLFLFISTLTTMNSHSEYYYSDNRQIPLLIDSSKITILLSEGGIIFDNMANVIETYDRIDSPLVGVGIIDNFRTFSINNSTNLSEFIDTLRNDPSIQMVNPYYMYAENEKLLIGNTICCKFYEETSYDFIDSLNNYFDVEIVYEKSYEPKEFLLKLNNNTTMSTLEIANLYYELPETEFCHPNFLGGFKVDGYPIYDYHWRYQWAMRRIFEAEYFDPEIKAFEITAGSPEIIIAVLDDGVAVHEDIPASRLLQGYDFVCDDDTPAPCNKPSSGLGYHGQAVAGIAGAGHTVDPDSANDQNTGVCGTAPNCTILPIKIWSSFNKMYFECCGIAEEDDQVIASRLARAIDTAWIMGADILANSWHSNSLYDQIIFSTMRAALRGRDGKGCGIFHSTGNNYSGHDIWPNMLPWVISVGAIDPNDEIWDYSNYGKVDVVAPGGSAEHFVDRIWSTDQMGEMGGNITGDYYDCSTPDDLDYLCSFNGTSSSQPVAAGVGALVLSRRPDLTNNELTYVIRNSADPNLYVTITNPPDQKYGYGMVHPLRALLAVSRGDVNNNGAVDILDIVFLINYKFKEGDPILPDVALGDTDCSGLINIIDIVTLINHLYKGADAPPFCFIYDYPEEE